MDHCETVEVIAAITPIVTAVLAAIPAYLTGLRRPRREELALRDELEQLRGSAGATDAD